MTDVSDHLSRHQGFIALLAAIKTKHLILENIAVLTVNIENLADLQIIIEISFGNLL